MNKGMYEDRVPIEGFKIPKIGDTFTLKKNIRFGSTAKCSTELSLGTVGEVIGIREPLKKNGGYVGCVVKFIDERFNNIYPAGIVIPWDEISDTEKFMF